MKHFHEYAAFSVSLHLVKLVYLRSELRPKLSPYTKLWS